jgi:phospholipase C
MKRRIRSLLLIFGVFVSISVGGAVRDVAGTVPNFSHIILIVMENKEFDEVIGNPKAPNFNGWAKHYALLTNYYSITHPSLPNYLALVAGDTFGIQEDCTDCYIKATSLPDLLEAKGRSWKTYQESLPSAGFTGNGSGLYVKKHDPFVYFDSIRMDRARRERGVVPLTELKADLKQGRLPDYAFIMPDLCHSSHSCEFDVTDKWLGTIVNDILRSPVFDQNALLVLTFDEGRTNLGGAEAPPLAAGGRIATILISPLVRPGYKDVTPYSHYSLLKTIAAAWGLEPPGHAGDPATKVIELPWRPNGAAERMKLL